MVYLKSAGSAWAMSDQSRFDTAYTQLTQNYCIDLNRVFATGHSSGAQFIEQMLCGGETRLKAVTPVAGSRTCASWQNPIPSMLIHGIMDNQRANDGNGFQEREPFITSHMCSMTTTPYTAVMACNSIHNQAAVNHGCVSYSGCAVPFVFCNHNDMNYGDTNHGWPCFANQAMYAFLSAL
jgi:poly(3-hydroxybutyrate) depolymerase